MNRARRCATFAVALAAVLPVTASAAAAPRSCAALSGGHVLADTTAVKVVRITSRDRHVQGSRVFGCAKPDGPVRLLGVSGIVDNHGATDQATTLGSVAGIYITLAKTYDFEASPGPDFRTVVNLRTGRSRQYYSGLISDCGADPTPPVAREILGADGRLLALYAAPADPAAPGCQGYRNPGLAQLRALRPDGQLQTLDLAPSSDLPADALALDGATARWTHAGAERTARIGAGRAVAHVTVSAHRCGQLRGPNLSPVARLRIVKAGARILGCEPRSNDQTVYALGPVGASASLKVDKVSGPVVAYTSTRGTHVTKGIVSLETGAAAIYWDADLGADCTKDLRAATAPPAAISLDARAGIAVAFANTDPATADCYPNAGQVLLQGFGGGDPITFDLAPAADLTPSSLHLKGIAVTWTRGGIPQHAAF